MSITRRKFLRVSSAVLTLPFAHSLLAGKTPERWSFGVIPDTQIARCRHGAYFNGERFRPTKNR